jgi:PEP-CTERM motif
MKFRTIAIICALLACTSISNASLILQDYSVDPAIQNPDVGWASGGPTDYSLLFSGNQQSSGSLSASLTQDVPGDPNIWVSNGFQNDTNYAWTDYHVIVKMDHPFNLSNAAVMPPPSDWTATPVALTPAVYDGSLWYVGYVDYQSGTPIAIGGELDFSYKISFDGHSSTNYCQELYPTPEPGTLLLLVCGVLGLWTVRRRFA